MRRCLRPVQPGHADSVMHVEWRRLSARRSEEIGGLDALARHGATEDATIKLARLRPHPRIFRVYFLSLQKIPQPSEFDDLFSGQDGARQGWLRDGVNFIQMMLGCRLAHELPYAFVKSALSYQVCSCAERGA